MVDHVANAWFNMQLAVAEAIVQPCRLRGRVHNLIIATGKDLHGNAKQFVVFFDGFNGGWHHVGFFRNSRQLTGAQGQCSRVSLLKRGRYGQRIEHIFYSRFGENSADERAYRVLDNWTK